MNSAAQSSSQPAGFTTLFAVLVASLLLAVGFTIFDITYKQLIFSVITRDSNSALYAADTGLECAFLWDIKYDGSANFHSGSVFATSSNSTAVPSSGVLCNGVDMAATPWAIQSDSSAATTTFTVTFAPQQYCAQVTVSKWGQPENTLIVSRGYNICNTNSQNRIERALQANY